MRTRFGRIALVAVLAAGLTSGLAAAGTLDHAGSTWAGTWEAAPASGVDNTPNGYPNYSIRNVVHTRIPGEVVVDEDTAALLIQLGWTPPTGDDDGNGSVGVPPGERVKG